MIVPICYPSCSVRNEPSVFKLARMIHKRFCCNRRSAALAGEASFVKREAQDGMSVSVSLHARYEIRFTRNVLSGDFATNRHELCGLMDAQRDE